MDENSSIWDHSVAQFREAIATQPTPGCGSVAAAIGAFGVALVLKSLHIAESKCSSSARAAQIAQANALSAGLTDAADRDRAAFMAYLRASGKPAGSGESHSQRERQLNSASSEMSEVPLAIAQDCSQGLALAVASFSLCSWNLRSDVIGGGILLHAGLSAALLTVDADIAALNDTQQQQETSHKRQMLQAEADRNRQWLMAQDRAAV